MQKRIENYSGKCNNVTSRARGNVHMLIARCKSGWNYYGKCKSIHQRTQTIKHPPHPPTPLHARVTMNRNINVINIWQVHEKRYSSAPLLARAKRTCFRSGLLKNRLRMVQIESRFLWGNEFSLQMRVMIYALRWSETLVMLSFFIMILSWYVY